jgi:prepilin-type N-terminal cleavage/methylation domain-containing protein
MTRGPRGFTLIELMIVVSIIGILALIAIPNFQKLRQKAFDASAISAGGAVRTAEEIYYQEHAKDVSPTFYTNSIQDLLSHDRNLADDHGVTFLFGFIGTTNYTFTTSHAKGAKTFVYVQ